MNTFGKNLRLTTFGESHGKAMGGVIDGFPSGFKIDFDQLQKDLDERKPGTSQLVTQRKEDDVPEFLSGINEEGITLGTPIGYIIRNKDHHSQDYDEMADKFRPNHADYTYIAKYGIRDAKGGGRASARETANWVVGGALASQWLKENGITVKAVLSGVKDANFTKEMVDAMINHPSKSKEIEISETFKHRIENKIADAKKKGDSIGGVVTCVINGVKAGIGDPVFRKLHASLAQAMMSINAAKGFEYGIGTSILEFSGIESADIFNKADSENIETATNFSGGIQGGISNGMPIFFSVYFKPTPTVMQDLPTIDTLGNSVILKSKGRHDPCVAVRAVPVVKAMASLVIADYLL